MLRSICSFADLGSVVSTEDSFSTLTALFCVCMNTIIFSIFNSPHRLYAYSESERNVHVYTNHEMSSVILVNIVVNGDIRSY